MTKKKLFLLKYLFLILAYICLFLPTLILFIKNRNVYFVRADGWTIGMAGAVGVAYICFLLKFGMKKFNPLVACCIVSFIMYCLDSVSEFLFVHSIALTIGVALFYCFKKPSDYFAKRLSVFVDEEDRETVRTIRRQKDTEETGRC